MYTKNNRFNGLSYMMQEKLKVPKNTATFQYHLTKEFNKYFIEFLEFINEKYSKDVYKNAELISKKYFSQYKEWFFNKF